VRYAVHREDPLNAAFLEDAELMAQVRNTPRPTDINPSDYVGILYALSHGTMWDFAESPELADGRLPLEPAVLRKRR